MRDKTLRGALVVILWRTHGTREKRAFFQPAFRSKNGNDLPQSLASVLKHYDVCGLLGRAIRDLGPVGIHRSRASIRYFIITDKMSSWWIKKNFVLFTNGCYMKKNYNCSIALLLRHCLSRFKVSNRAQYILVLLRRSSRRGSAGRTQ